MPAIEVTVTATGETTVEAKQIKGQSCRKLTEAIERAIGATVADQAKPELHQSASLTQPGIVSTSR